MPSLVVTTILKVPGFGWPSGTLALVSPSLAIQEEGDQPELGLFCKSSPSISVSTNGSQLLQWEDGVAALLAHSWVHR